MSLNNSIAYLQAFNKPTNYGEFDFHELKFNHGVVSRHEFNRNYSKEGWQGRKVVALPLALWNTIVKTIYTLAKLIILFPIKIFKERSDLTAHFYHIIRDLEEGLGWLATLFNDRYGQFLIQDSQFHKKAYNNFLTKGSEKSTIFSNLIDFYDKNDDLKSAIKLFNHFQIYDDNYRLKLSELSLKKGCYKDAFKALRNINISDKDAFLAKVVQQALENNDNNFAWKAVGQIYGQNKNIVLVEMARVYLSRNNEEQVILAIRSILFNLSLRESYYNSNNIDVEALDKLGNKIYEKIKNEFSNHDNKDILDSIDFEFLNFKRNYNNQKAYEEAKSQKYESSSGDSSTYYDILGLPKGASLEQIKKAFKKLTLQFHPDRIIRNKDEDESSYLKRKNEAQEKFKSIANAYEMLTGK